MSGLRRQLGDREKLQLYREVLVDIRDNYDCDTDAHRYNTTCRCCAAKMALEGKDPWDRDIQTFHLDELPAGKYIAYVGGYRDEGVVSYELVPEGTPLNLKAHVPFDSKLSIEAETDVMPGHAISGGSIVKLEILEPSGYKVLKVLRK